MATGSSSSCRDRLIQAPVQGHGTPKSLTAASRGKLDQRACSDSSHLYTPCLKNCRQVDQFPVSLQVRSISVPWLSDGLGFPPGSIIKNASSAEPPCRCNRCSITQRIVARSPEALPRLPRWSTHSPLYVVWYALSHSPFRELPQLPKAYC